MVLAYSAMHSPFFFSHFYDFDLMWSNFFLYCIQLYVLLVWHVYLRKRSNILFSSFCHPFVLLDFIYSSCVCCTIQASIVSLITGYNFHTMGYCYLIWRGKQFFYRILKLISILSSASTSVRCKWLPRHVYM